MATVYLATQASLRRKVALKTVAVLDEGAQPSLATTHLGDTQSIERLIEEARMIASLSHPNIVTVFDIGATDELLYIAMEYLQGGDLSARIRAVMPVRMCLSVLLAIAHALEFAHAQNVIHRDVKPANILFREDDTLVLSDFGLAKRVTQDIGLTQTELVLGSPFYMSPEQIEAGQIDEASDTYNLGVVLFEMLSGHLPFAADNAYNLMMQHLKAPIPTLAPQLSALQTLLNGMLAKRAEERFSIAQVLSQLSQLQGAMTFPVEHQPVIVVSDTGLLSEVIEKIRQGVAEDLAADRVVLPTLPEVAMKVRDVVSSADVTAKEIAQIVATDPGLSARLLRVANSATYAGATPPRSRPNGGASWSQDGAAFGESARGRATLRCAIPSSHSLTRESVVAPQHMGRDAQRTYLKRCCRTRATGRDVGWSDSRYWQAADSRVGANDSTCFL